MDVPSISRRRLLRTGGAALSTVALTSAAGCAALGDGGDDDTGLPAYATWAPAPERVLNTSEGLNRYAIETRRFDALAAYHTERGGSFDETTLYQGGMAHPVIDVSPSEAGLEVRAGGRGITVLETELTDDRIVEAFQTPDEDSTDALRVSFERVGEYEGYDLLSRPDGGWVVAVNDGTVVEAFVSAFGRALPENQKQEVVEATIDARDGEGRYIDASDDLALVVDRLGDGMQTRVQPPSSGSDGEAKGEPTARGIGYTDAGGGVRDGRWVLAFESPEAAEAYEVNTGAGADPAGSWRDTSVERDGRSVVVTGRVTEN